MPTDAVLFSLWLAYVIIKDVVKPLIQMIKNRREENGAHANGSMHEIRTKVAVLEIDLSAFKAQVVDFKSLLDRNRQEQDAANIAMDNKLDMVLSELREVSQRLSVVETHVQHLREDKWGHGA